MLRARLIVEARERQHSVEDIEAAQRQFDEVCERDDVLRHTRRLPRTREHTWMKVWDEEIIPAKLLCAHRGLQGATIQLANAGARGIDLLIFHEGTTEKVEMSLAYPARHPDWNRDGRTSPGAQEALRSEMLNRVGWVSSREALRRNRKTGEPEYEDVFSSAMLSDPMIEWGYGISYALRKKNRGAGYGEGSTLAIYCYGLSGEFQPPRKRVCLNDVLMNVPAASLLNGFVRTAIFSWHASWYAEIVDGVVIPDARFARDPEPRES